MAPVPLHGSMSPASRARVAKSELQAPTKTPVEEPCNRSGGMPACSKASHAVCRSRRWWGSIWRASRGAIPKKAASKRSTSGRNPPKRLYIRPGASGSGSYHWPRSQRSGGTSVMPSRPWARRSQKASGAFAPPGKWQPMPITAIGSSGIRCTAAAPGAAIGPAVPVAVPATGGATASGWGRPSVRASTSSRWSARRSAVGWSKARVTGRATRNSFSRWLRSSTAIRESRPCSWKGRAVSTRSGEARPRQPATSLLTASTSIARSWGDGLCRSCACKLEGGVWAARGRSPAISELPAQVG